MRKLIAVLPFLFAASAQAAPHLYGNVEDTVTHCGMVLDGAPKVTVEAIAGNPKQCKFDLAGINTGPHTATMTAIILDPVWGNQESVPTAPFLFTKPATPTVPTSLLLAP
jgi:hypothetical protein